jgi:hypothetical protein
MTELIDSLEAAFSALQASFPEQAKSFLPGLPKKDIRTAVENLGLPCPDELVDLYHWRNGSTGGSLRYGFPPELIFLPLEEVVNNYMKSYSDCDELQVLDTIRWDHGIDAVENILSPLGIEEITRYCLLLTMAKAILLTRCAGARSPSEADSAWGIHLEAFRAILESSHRSNIIEKRMLVPT